MTVHTYKDGPVFITKINRREQRDAADWATANALKKINEAIKASMPRGNGQSWRPTLHNSSVSTCVGLNSTNRNGCEIAAPMC